MDSLAALIALEIFLNSEERVYRPSMYLDHLLECAHDARSLATQSQQGYGDSTMRAYQTTLDSP